VRRSGSPCGRLHCGGRKHFAATPRNRERVEQGYVGRRTRAGSGRSDLPGLSNLRHLFCSPGACARPDRLPLRSSVALVFSIAHLTTAGTTALQLCCIILTGCLYGWVRRRYRSTAAAALAHASVQPGALPQLLGRPFALTRCPVEQCTPR